jgi:hypothetical protein
MHGLNSEKLRGCVVDNQYIAKRILIIGGIILVIQKNPIFLL